MSDTGGAAFPVQMQKTENGDMLLWPESGMTLRDYFAAHIAGGLVSDARSLDLMMKASKGVVSELIAMNAYAAADAMLKERAK